MSVIRGSRPPQAGNYNAKYILNAPKGWSFGDQARPQCTISVSHVVSSTERDMYTHLKQDTVCRNTVNFRPYLHSHRVSDSMRFPLIAGRLIQFMKRLIISPHAEVVHGKM